MSTLNLDELCSLTLAERPYSEIYLPESLPAGWAIAEPYQVGPVTGFVDANPYFMPAALGYRTGYEATFTDGEDVISILVDPEDVWYEGISDWDRYEKPAYQYLRIYLDGAEWQVGYTDTLALTYVEPDSDVNPDGFCGVYIWSTPGSRALALDFASRTVGW